VKLVAEAAPLSHASHAHSCSFPDGKHTSRQSGSDEFAMRTTRFRLTGDGVTTVPRNARGRRHRHDSRTARPGERHGPVAESKHGDRGWPSTAVRFRSFATAGWCQGLSSRASFASSPG